MQTKQNSLSSVGFLVAQYAQGGEEAVLQLLLLAGISPDQKTDDGNTLTHLAAAHAVQSGDADALRKLVDYGANLYVKNKDGKTVLDVLKANPKLEDEVRKAWLRGSGKVGLRDSTTPDGESPLGELGGPARKSGPRADTKETGNVAGASGVIGKLDSLWSQKRKKLESLARPEVEDPEKTAALDKDKQELLRGHSDEGMVLVPRRA